MFFITLKIFAKVTFLMRNTHNGLLLCFSNELFQFFCGYGLKMNDKQNFFNYNSL